MEKTDGRKRGARKRREGRDVPLRSCFFDIILCYPHIRRYVETPKNKE
jgi:hypothetical protein